MQRRGFLHVRRALVPAAFVAFAAFVASCNPIPPVGPAPPPAAPSGWPGPSNTGVPAGTALTVVNGGVTLSQAGQVFDARDVRGMITVTAPNVTISRSRVEGGISSRSSNLMIVDTEIGPASGSGGGDWAVGDGGYTCLRCNVHNFSDGFRTGGGRDVTIQDSWVHDLSLGAGAHNDGIQRYAPGKPSNDVIRHNFIDCFAWTPNGERRVCTTAAIFYADNWQGNLLLDNNLLAGGVYSLRIHESGTARVLNNRFVRGSYSSGPTNNLYGNIVEWVGNALDNGTPVGG